MGTNDETLAKIVTLHAIGQAQQAHLPPPLHRVMKALEAALDDCRTRLTDLALLGRLDTPEYRKIEAQLIEWDAAWRSNR
ncbi:hypothetical protein KDW40_25380 [Burkholderia cenocepacia]|uniref:hypothetical protein n=1 Tax=Burkholderia TaxID=32008 RepID=UPI0005C79451|nr:MULTISPECIES: hypothetical protein [Burkholderia]MBR8043474.1 hypothetical protein [Burkholderia cenocepacia]MBR8329063.1 hypothetical protein [Burkholderia cenocepacia]